MSLHIGRWTFRTQTAADRHVQDILERHRHMQSLSGQDDEFMRALIDIHPGRAEIFNGCAIRWIYVEDTAQIYPGARGWRFSVMRGDYSRFDFAWRWAIHPRNPFEHLSHVLRNEIKEYVQLIKRERFRGICEYEHCLRPLTLAECHLDHIAPQTFQALVQGFLNSIHKTAANIEIRKSTAYGASSYLANPIERDAWMEYHQINARLRVVCPTCNLSTLNRRSRRAAV